MIRRILVCGLLLMILSACAVATPAEGTLTMQNATLGTQMAFVRQTATFEANLNMRTLEYLGTAKANADDRQESLIGTLQAHNLPIDSSLVGAITPIIMATNIPTQAANNVSGIGVTVIPPTLDPNAAPATPTPQPTAAVAIDPNSPNVTGLVTSTGVDNNDCAVGATTQFTTASTEIYAVATANKFPRGFSATFSWLREGAVVYSDSFTWDFAIDGACIWYFVTPSDFEFTPGTYTVQIDNGGIPIGTPATFTITGG